ncbi:hypothetical protein [Sphingobium yanoikuyae]|uniref:hypothetical protein n=1 Tax=Sphingobium yanoikuyae TaxID=13690 RepID=UPI0028AB263B|nr:hypothetical protein [Sphingobium yanoikuyae]
MRLAIAGAGREGREAGDFGDGRAFGHRSLQRGGDGDDVVLDLCDVIFGRGRIGTETQGHAGSETLRRVDLEHRRARAGGAAHEAGDGDGAGQDGRDDRAGREEDAVPGQIGGGQRRHLAAREGDPGLRLEDRRIAADIGGQLRAGLRDQTVRRIVRKRDGDGDAGRLRRVAAEAHGGVEIVRLLVRRAVEAARHLLEQARGAGDDRAADAARLHRHAIVAKKRGGVAQQPLRDVRLRASVELRRHGAPLSLK